MQLNLNCEQFFSMIKGPDHAANVPLSVSQTLGALNAKNVNVITNNLIQVLNHHPQMKRDIATNKYKRILAGGVKESINQSKIE